MGCLLGAAQGDTYVFALTVDSDVYVWGGAGKAPLGLQGQDEEYKRAGTRKGSQATVDRCCPHASAGSVASTVVALTTTCLFRHAAATPTFQTTFTIPTRTRRCGRCLHGLSSAWVPYGAVPLDGDASMHAFACITHSSLPWHRYDAAPEGAVWMTPYYLESMRGEGVVQIAVGYVPLLPLV